MDYIFTVRRVRKDVFDNEPGSTYFLAVPEDAHDLSPLQTVGRPGRMPKKWLNAVLREAKPKSPSDQGDLLVYVHGFNVSTQTMLSRHRLIKSGLHAQGYQGGLVSFDWPSADKALNYLEDRSDAKESARRLVDEGIAIFAQMQEEDCQINVHILAHSMGAYVVREAFDDADDRRALASANWMVSQIMFASADVSAASMSEGNPKSSSLYRHCNRLTNYSNPYDGILSLSGIKRLGVAPRVGRVGLPDDAPEKAVNVDTGPYFDANRDQFQNLEYPGHSWYFQDATFMKDVHETIRGQVDRNVIKTRFHANTGFGPKLALKM
ncbi:alpha/beta hydrolase [Pseudaestuariivita rosea]|uniref:alpha/beta hydrolase n=1 Tax=Pseudaestuariivita rosea TaxID=2763263 RepID=UPI001ABB8AAD|nr:alpha/beta hydrolase [Pseudaestuariivita rosea]